MKGSALFLLLAGATQVFAAGVYKWVDEDGQVHYGQQPPTTVQQVDQVTLDQAASSSSMSVDERRERLQRAIDASDEARAQRQEQEAKSREQAERARQNCAVAQRRVNALATGGRLYRMDENGERRYVTDEQRSSELAQAQAQVAKWCR